MPASESPHAGPSNDSETAPLLTQQHASHAAISQDEESDHAETPGSHTEDDTETRSIIPERIKRHFLRARFYWFCLLGVLGIIIFHMSFLPRTSLSRDVRRWYDMHLTKMDVERMYLVYSGLYRSEGETTNEEHINEWLTNLTLLNSKQAESLLSDDNKQLTEYVENRFRDFGLETESFTYSTADLQKPLSLKVALVDPVTGAVLYTPKLTETGFSTPAYNGLGVSANVAGDYIYVNEGRYCDYQLLLEHKIDVREKVVIVKLQLGASLSESLLVAQHFGAIGLVSYNHVNLANKEHADYLKRSVSRQSTSHNPFGSFGNLSTPAIPSIPISLAAIGPILDTLCGGPELEDWDHFPLSDSSITMELSTEFTNNKSRKVTNIVGSIKGIMSDGDVIIGTPRDSFTSSNPLSGHAIMFEIMRHFQKLISKGWKPLRTIKFVSWDATHNGLLGSQFAANDTGLFTSNQPNLCYINIDGDAVTGSKFVVDSNPMINKVLRKTAKYVRMPKSSKLARHTSQRYLDDEYETLEQYWLRQDNLTINNVLGEKLKLTDALVFQTHLQTPVVNIKFENDEKRDTSLYIPNSNYYSYNWLIERQIDSDLLFHGLLIRYLGLLLITLSEHEVAYLRTHDYLHKVSNYFEGVLEKNEDRVEEWSSKEVDVYLINNSELYYDLKNDFPSSPSGNKDPVIRYRHLIEKLSELFNSSVVQSAIFDKYNKDVQDSLIEDFPWYKLLKKLHIYAKFKVSNYKLLRVEKDLSLDDNDYAYLSNGKPSEVNTADSWFKSIVYGVPKFRLDLSSGAEDRSVFSHLFDAFIDKDFDMSVKWIATIYEKLKVIHDKID